uniref:zona pellucida sperm-binding protein 3-like n=1 Tax=Pristiophorus japonicus TaxID=55135 RepID=UPI00398E6370
MTDDLLIYTTHLYYKPSHIGGVIVRTSGAVVPIVCHYPRKRTVSSNAIKPTWVPFSSTKAGEGRLSFSLRLMTANWSAERTSNIYHLGDLIHIEASVMTVNHMPLKLYIDRCIATLSPDQDSTPRYNIIDFNGCLLDSRDEDSFSSFVSPRDHLDKLQFKLDAFRFFEDDRDLIFITCHLKVAAADQRPDSVNKACSFQKPANRWSLVTELDLSMVEGSNEVCACCDGGNCGASRLRSGGRLHSRDRREVLSELESEPVWEGEVSLGPLIVLDADLKDLVHSMGSEAVETREEIPSSSPGEVLLVVTLAVGALISATLVAAFLFRKHT